jgi:hypothetical protein
MLNLSAFDPASLIMQELAHICMRADGDLTRRADANETMHIALALQAAGVAAVKRIYAGITFRRLAPLQEGISPGAETYTWQEYDIAGMAAIIANYAKDLPNVSQSALTNTGVIRTIADAFMYSKQDLRRAGEASRNGRMAEYLSPDNVSIARQFIERKKDQVAYLGDTTYNLPGILKNPNVATVNAGAPAAGSSKLWTGVDKTGDEIMGDLRMLVGKIDIQSQGNFSVTGPEGTIVMPIEEAAALRSKPLSAANQAVTVWKQFTDEYPQVELIETVRAKLANATNNGPRVLAYQKNGETVRMVEPLEFEASAPQPDGLNFKVACDSRFGGVFIKQPLAFQYMDFV